MGTLINRVRDWLRPGPRLIVFAPDNSLGTHTLEAVTIRVSSTTSRIALTAIAVSGSVVVGLSPWLLPDFNVLTLFGLLPVGISVLAGVTRTPVTDPAVARAAVRAAVNEGRQLGPRRWRIDGQAARELGTELKHLQGWWVPGSTSASAPPDAAREALLAQRVSPRLAPYLGPVSPNERLSWFGTTPEVGPGPEPDHRAQSYQPGQPWPTLGAAEPEWPTLPPREKT